jgi:hypothetical protein
MWEDISGLNLHTYKLLIVKSITVSARFISDIENPSHRYKKEKHNPRTGDGYQRQAKESYTPKY